MPEQPKLIELGEPINPSIPSRPWENRGKMNMQDRGDIKV